METNKTYDMEISSGIVIIYDSKILLAKPYKGNNKSWSIPKGKVELDETFEDAAVRETFEEIGIKIDPTKLKNKKVIVYTNRISNEEHKKLYYYVYRIKNLDEIGLKNETIPKTQLGVGEIIDARFMYKSEAEDFIFWRQEPILKLINNKMINIFK